jgi:hypothetical protein
VILLSLSETDERRKGSPPGAEGDAIAPRGRLYEQARQGVDDS